MANYVEVETLRSIILFSYTTPVVFFDKTRNAMFVTKKKHSKTTSKHIGEFWKDFEYQGIQEIAIEQNDIKSAISLL